jgi:hypothetical protein
LSSKLSGTASTTRSASTASSRRGLGFTRAAIAAASAAAIVPFFAMR